MGFLLVKSARAPIAMGTNNQAELEALRDSDPQHILHRRLGSAALALRRCVPALRPMATITHASWM
jgi:hypothetical protein